MPTINQIVFFFFFHKCKQHQLDKIEDVTTSSDHSASSRLEHDIGYWLHQLTKSHFLIYRPTGPLTIKTSLPKHGPKFIS